MANRDTRRCSFGRLHRGQPGRAAVSIFLDRKL
jgi:hypothetical protein